MVKKLTKLLIMIALWGNTTIVYAEKSTKVNRRDDMPNKFNETVLLEDSLPNYVTADISNLEASSKTSIRIPASSVKFPLSKEDKKDIEILIRKFDNEENCAGLAAPQIGISKRVIVFAVPDDPLLKKWRPDIIQAMPKTLWINPSYKPIGTEMYEDYEGCFSVKDVTGPVKRYKKINYRAFDQEGKIIEGQAEGFTARVIQHEIDHLDGKLFIDLVPKDKIMSREEYIKKRAEALKEKDKIEN
ncbi:MAG: peptide deformylase [Rickettsia endosymbiont of Labidopullus appendiculatus]|nr:peptide deformylase [Rickettsia endosymbiont of Labidopullus appendiculatus]